MSVLPELLRKQLKLLYQRPMGGLVESKKNHSKGKGEKEKHAVKADQLGC